MASVADCAGVAERIVPMRRASKRAGKLVTFVMPKWWQAALTQRRARCQSLPVAATTQTGTGRPGNRDAKETNVIILLPLLRCLSARTRLAVGLVLTTVGLFLIIAALAHGVIALIVGAIVLMSVRRGRQRERLT